MNESVKKEIIEIKIETEHIFMLCKHKEDAYRDSLKISKHRISYERKNFFGDSQYDKYWDYQTNSDEYENNYMNLCMVLNRIDSPKFYETDEGGFRIKIRYSDGTSNKLEFSGDFRKNKLLELASSIHRLVPNKAAISGLMDVVHNFVIPYPEMMRFIMELTDIDKISKMDNRYPLWVWELFEYLPPDYKYHLITEKLLERRIPISSYDIDEIRAMMTYIMRSEHFSTGSILEYIKDGTLLKLLLRLQQLNEKNY